MHNKLYNLNFINLNYIKKYIKNSILRIIASYGLMLQIKNKI
jgi:hypothetical protein